MISVHGMFEERAPHTSAAAGGVEQRDVGRRLWMMTACVSEWLDTMLMCCNTLKTSSPRFINMAGKKRAASKKGAAKGGKKRASKKTAKK